MRSTQGIWATVSSRFDGFKLGERVYLKPVEFKFSTPVLYDVVDPATGARTGRQVDGNEFKINFEK